MLCSIQQLYRTLTDIFYNLQLNITLRAESFCDDGWWRAPRAVSWGTSNRRLRATPGTCLRLQHGSALRAVSLRDDISPSGRKFRGLHTWETLPSVGYTHG